MKKRTLITMVIIAMCTSLTIAAQQKKEKKYKAYLVSNAHLDTQWRWDVKTTIDEFLYNTAVQNLALLDSNPNYIFNCEAAIKYMWIKEYYPDLYARIAKYVKEGRWHISGASLDANDPNMPSPESFFRNILIGQEFYKKEFNKKSTDLFLPDCFGFGYIMPTIASHCDLIGFSTQKLTWRQQPLVDGKKAPFPIGLWQGVDGSRIMAALESKTYTWTFPEGDLSNNKHLIEDASKTNIPVAYRYYGTKYSNNLGDRGGSPSLRTVQILEEGLKGDGEVEIISATSDQLYKDFLPYSSHPELPIYDGEMLLDVHAPGCYTSQAEMKRYNRRNEQLADAAERAAVMADWLGTPYPKKILNDAWTRFLWHQFHDDLTGTSIADAYTYSWNDEILAQTQFTDIITQSTEAIVSNMDTRVSGTSLVVYNPTAYNRTSLVEANIATTNKATNFEVYAPNGKRVPSQLLSKENNTAKIIFSAEMQPVSYAVYDIRSSNKKTTNPNLKVTTNSLENTIYKVTLNRDGDISSILDKRTNKELIENGQAFRLTVLGPNTSNKYPAWEIYKKTIDEKPVGINENVKISIAEEGSLKATLKVEKSYGASKFIQYISLTDGANDDRIDVRTDIDWGTKNALLKAEFPMSVSNEKATYDLGLGAIQRKTNTIDAHETYAQHWADITNNDESYGISILNDSKYGWDKPNDNTLRLTLLHTPSAEKKYPEQQVLDFGLHTMTYSIVGHIGNYKDSGIVKKGEELNQPLLSFTTPKHSGKLGKTFSFATSSTPQIAIKAIKKAENGDGYIVRIHETEGCSVENAEITFPTEILSAEELNGIEEYKEAATANGNKLIVNAGKFTPKTYKVRLKESAIKVAPIQNQSVELEFNQVAMSSDAFRPMAKMDKERNSYAAELIPATINHAGIDFEMGKADLKNAIMCDSNIITLPTDKKYNKVYILAAAADNEKVVTFTVDGKTHEINVPYFSGFVGQWAWSDFTKSFVKEGTIAHISNHRHTPKGNDSYVFTYIYKLEIDIPAGAKQLVLPKDKNTAVFAVTVSNNTQGEVKLALEPRALPIIQ